jgi:hypothetical protein
MMGFGCRGVSGRYGRSGRHGGRAAFMSVCSFRARAGGRDFRIVRARGWCRAYEGVAVQGGVAERPAAACWRRA